MGWRKTTKIPKEILNQYYEMSPNELDLEESKLLEEKAWIKNEISNQLLTKKKVSVFLKDYSKAQAEVRDTRKLLDEKLKKIFEAEIPNESSKYYRKLWGGYKKKVKERTININEKIFYALEYDYEHPDNPVHLTKEEIKDYIKKDKAYSPLSAQMREYGERIGVIDKIIQTLPTIKKKAKAKQRTNRLASYEDKTRQIGKGIIKDIRDKASEQYFCPYCNLESDKDDSHVDHIHPVSKGGLSVEMNMVLVCSACNLKKKDLTLFNFANKYDLDFEEIATTLGKLGKDV